MVKHGLSHPARRALDKLGKGDEILSILAAFKAGERKDDPARRDGLRGPYETLTLFKTGRLPDECYDESDPEPWKLRVEESRSGIIWQVVKGVVDFQPEFASSYLALALDKSLSDDDYAKELGTLNKDFIRFMEAAATHTDHLHGSMTGIYKSVSCPACSIATAIAIRDAGVHLTFMEMVYMKPQDRAQLLKERGLMPLMNEMIPDQPKLIVG